MFCSQHSLVIQTEAQCHKHLKRYTTIHSIKISSRGIVADMSKILGTGRHMKQYALAKGHTRHNTMWYFVPR